MVPGSPFSVTVNATNLPSINDYRVSLTYNSTVVDPVSIDHTVGITSTWTVVALDCIDGNPQEGSKCAAAFDQLGVATLELGSIDTVTSPNINGTLFKINFNVVGSGFSLIHFRQVALNGFNRTTTTYTQISYPSTNLDGYFTNKNCYNNQLCTPAVAKVGALPSRLVLGRAISFNATASHGTNGPKDNLTSYTWDWGDGNTIAPVATPLTTHRYLYAQSFTVTLLVKDFYGAQGGISFPVNIIRVWTELSIQLQALSTTVANPGAQISFTAFVQNKGTNTTTSSVSLKVENMTLSRAPLPLLPPDGTATSTVIWNTTGVSPQAYKVLVQVDLITQVINGTVHVLNNETSDATSFAYVLIQVPIPSGFGAFLGLNMTEFFGLGALVVGFAGLGIPVLLRAVRKKPSFEIV